MQPDSRSMRVLHVYSGNLYGGIEAILLALHVEHRSAQFRHEFALCFEGRLTDELRAAGASTHHLGAVRLSRPHTAHRARRSLAALLRRGSFDRVICHAPWAQAIFGGTVRRADLPLVFWAHDVMTGEHWTERLARRTPPDLAICNSRYTAGTLARLYPDVRSVAIYAPLRLANGSTAAGEDRRGIRASLQTPEDAVVVMQASRSEWWKGHTLMVDALARLRELPGWVWWLAGGAQRPVEAAFLESIRARAAEKGIADRVRWLGERDDVPRLLSAADIYCQPNLAPEPFGISLVEALAAALPVVTTRMGGAIEIVDEECGALVNPNDPAALAATLSMLITDEAGRARRAAAGPARARHLCDPALQLDRLHHALMEVTAVPPVEA
jgi:glycosyltransferase involved in cell wall biosynthesis